MKMPICKWINCVECFSVFFCSSTGSASWIREALSKLDIDRDPSFVGMTSVKELIGAASEFLMNKHCSAAPFQITMTCHPYPACAGEGSHVFEIVSSS